MKRILLISHDASLTGAPKSILLISKMLKEEGCEIRWIVGKTGPRSDDFEQDKSKYWDKDLSNEGILKRILFRIQGSHKGHKDRIISWVKAWRPDLILNNTVVNGEILERLAILDVKIISRIPELQSVMAYYDTFDKSTTKVFKHSNVLVAASDSVKLHLVDFWNQPEMKVKVIYTGSDMIPLPKEEHDGFVVSGCGSLISRKGIDLFLLVANECIKRDIKDIKFQWIGGNIKSLGYFEALEDIRKLGLGNYVKIMPETKDIRPYLSKSDIFLMTSKEDPFPIVNIEALKHNLPLICFAESGGSEDIVRNGGGIAVPYMDITEMANQLIEIQKKKKSEFDISQTIDIFSTHKTKESWISIVK